jgi:hypothetical protein
MAWTIRMAVAGACLDHAHGGSHRCCRRAALDSEALLVAERELLFTSAATQQGPSATMTHDVVQSFMATCFLCLQISKRFEELGAHLCAIHAKETATLDL